MRVQVGEDKETLEEVFDGRTLTTGMHRLNRGRLRELQGTVKSGKESRIYRGIDMKGGDVAVKIYLTSSAIFRQGRLKYIRGDPRFKDIPHDTRSLIDQWSSKEFKNLQLGSPRMYRSEEHTSELQSPYDLVCRLLLEKKNRVARPTG